MKCHRRKPRVHPPRSSTSALVVAWLLILLPTVLHAQAAWDYDQDVHVTYEFDDNVDEAISDPVRAQIARLAYSGELQWGEAGAQRLSLSYEGGFKRHFGLVGNDFDLANQFVNEGGVGYVRRISTNLALGGAFAIKNRKWTDDFFFINEDGFTSVGGEASATLNLRPLAPDRPARLEIGTRFARVDFENLDQPFDERSVGGFTSLTKDFGEDLAVTWQYALDRIRYPGRGVVRADDDDPANAFRGLTRPRQVDYLHELGGQVVWLGPFSVQGEYYFRYNDSNSFGLSYLSHNIGLQVIRRLPWDMLAQVYGLIELRSFSEPAPNLSGAGTLDTSGASNNVLLLRLVKDVNSQYSIEIRYGYYRNESITVDDFYTKNVYSLGMNFRP
jgi:hypothetical protein